MGKEKMGSEDLINKIIHESIAFNSIIENMCISNMCTDPWPWCYCDMKSQLLYIKGELVKINNAFDRLIEEWKNECNTNIDYKVHSANHKIHIRYGCKEYSRVSRDSYYYKIWLNSGTW